MEGKLDVIVKAHGGGLSGQAGAVRLGIARALLALDPEMRPVLKKADLLARDPRMVERKKFGRRKARALINTPSDKFLVFLGARVYSLRRGF